MLVRVLIQHAIALADEHLFEVESVLNVAHDVVPDDALVSQIDRFLTLSRNHVGPYAIAR